MDNNPSRPRKSSRPVLEPIQRIAVSFTISLVDYRPMSDCVCAGHFGVGGQPAGTHKNRTIYKRKIEFKTIEVYEKCPEGATGSFVYHLSCNQFLNCWKGRGEVQNCAPGTLFNPKTLECDFPEKVECFTGTFFLVL